MALVVCRIRRGGNPPRVVLAGSSIEPRAARIESGSGPTRCAGGLLRLLRTPTVLCLLGAFLCANFVAVVLLSWMPKFLYESST